MVGDERTDEILETIKKIQESRQPVKKYFENNFVPFSRSQYYIYCKTLQKYGEEGLYDHREEGNNTKLTQRIKDFVVSTVKENRSISSSKLKDKIASVFGLNFFLIKCFDREKFELLTLMESIFQLDGSASVSSDRKVIDIEMNPKEPDLMNKLYKGLQILNTMQVHDLDGRMIEFRE